MHRTRRALAAAVAVTVTVALAGCAATVTLDFARAPEVETDKQLSGCRFLIAGPRPSRIQGVPLRSRVMSAELDSLTFISF